MAKLSKQVENRLVVSGKVVAAAKAHGAEIAKGLALKAEAAQGIGNAPSAMDYQVIIASMTAMLEGETAALKEAELAYSLEQADDVAPRNQREKAAAEAFGLMVKVRATAETVLGSSALQTYGLEGETPRAARMVASHMDNVIKLLAEQPVSVTSDLGTTFDSQVVATAIVAKRDVLAAALGDVDREARELEDALGKRDQAIEAWSDAYQGTATALEGMCRLAGRKDLAERVRPTSRKVSGEDTGDEGGGETGAGGSGG